MRLKLTKGEIVIHSKENQFQANLIKKEILAIVVPCYNEEEVLPETASQLLKKIQSLVSSNIISSESKILFVDDGSTDNTWAMIEKFCENNPQHFAGIKLSKNKGHQNALLCGLYLMKDIVDVTISIDADLQDDINAIDEMMEKYGAGCEIVYGVRSERKKDSFAKKITAQGFYKFMKFLGADIVYNHADFRLMGKTALSAFAEYQETNIFIRGIVPLLGFKTDVVYYSRQERFAGVSKYPLKKMLQFALNGITSFSIRPIRLITLIGIALFTISVLMIIYSFYRHYSGNTIIGWASIVCSLWGIGGLILFSIGIVGEYIGKIYLETKNRPKYHVEQFLFRRNNQKD